MDVSKELIRSIVEKVLAESAGTAAPAEPYKEKDPSGIIKITTDWTLTYDEYDCVVEGTLEIEINGNVLTAKPGEIIYIPKGSHIHFQTPNYAKYWYFVYPANWAEL